MRFTLTDVVCAVGIAVLTVAYLVWGIATVIDGWVA